MRSIVSGDDGTVIYKVRLDPENKQACFAIINASRSRGNMSVVLVEANGIWEFLSVMPK